MRAAGQAVVLVTGGAGYIGSHFVNLLKNNTQMRVVVVDDLREPDNVHNILRHDRVSYYRVEISDAESLQPIFANHAVDIVVHYAAVASVPGSVSDPASYYQNNLTAGLVLLECMRRHGVSKLLFSSSAAVYGEKTEGLITESAELGAINPYGFTKQVFERILQDYAIAYGIDSISFRYFCAAGADESMLIGERHVPESHIIPSLLAVASGKRTAFEVYGADYQTPDGTGIRDYIHVNDLATAHYAALQYLLNNKGVCERYNLGINKGYSVFELLRIVEAVTNKHIPYVIKPRRPGDPASLIADATAAQHALGWRPQYVDMKVIVETAYKFYSTQL